MSPLNDEAPLRLDRPGLVEGVREVLDKAGFDEAGIAQQCGVSEMARLGFGPLDRPRLLWRTRDESPLSTLIRLFLIGMPVDLATLRRAVAPMDRPTGPSWGWSRSKGRRLVPRSRYAARKGW